jgi:hypothetical protein
MKFSSKLVINKSPQQYNEENKKEDDHYSVPPIAITTTCETLDFSFHRKYENNSHAGSS